MRIPGTQRRSNYSQSLKEINSGYSLEGLMLKLKLQYFGHLMQRAGSLEKPLLLGKTEGKRRRGWQRIRWLDGITDSRDMNLSKPGETVCSARTGKPGVLQSMGPRRVGHHLVMEKKQLAGWDQTDDEQKHSALFCPRGVCDNFTVNSRCGVYAWK